MAEVRWVSEGKQRTLHVEARAKALEKKYDSVNKLRAVSP